MQKVPNRKCIRKISMRTLKAAKTRNIIAIFAISLTTMLFTSVFTIGMSMNKSFQEYNFRQVGGDAHGTYKELTEEQIKKLSSNPLIQDWGEKICLGLPSKVPFNKSHVEVNWYDEFTAKHAFCTPEVGRLPKEGTNEAATDTRVLKLLGVEPKIGEEFTITYNLGDGTATSQEVTSTFTLSGYWQYDSANACSVVEVPKTYAEEILAKNPPSDATGIYGKRFLDVMFQSSLHIEKDMEQVLENQGYQGEDQEKDHYISYGVNWGYTGAQLSDKMDFTTVLGIVVAILLIICSGYLIIYNIFRISVTGDIRFYGLLKTIGTTGKQIKKIIRRQILLLSVVGIPIGLLAGWGVGAVLTPLVMSNMSYKRTTMSTSPIIFVGAALFAFVTLILSVRKPAKIASKVSPVEAVKYMESSHKKKGQKKREKGARTTRMAFANLGRSKSKTVLVVLSLALAVVLLNMTYTFTNGFDMDKYLENYVCTDFIFGHANYFQSAFASDEEEVPEDVISDIEAQGGIKEAGRIYGQVSTVQQIVDKKQVEESHSAKYAGEHKEEYVASHRLDDGTYYDDFDLYGMEEFPLSKVDVIDGSLDGLMDASQNKIAAVAQVDDYGNPIKESQHYQVGDKVKMRYIEEFQMIDSRTGELANEQTPAEYRKMKILKMHEKTYTVCALVSMRISLGYRFWSDEQMILPAQEFVEQTNTSAIMSYVYDMKDKKSIDQMEAFLKDYTKNAQPEYDFDSKQSYSDEFESFRSMFLLMGSALSGIIGMIGILNFINAVLTSAIARKREFAVLQAIGMTGKQLMKMMILEGCIYAIGAIALACILNLIFAPIIANVLGSVFWFYTYHFLMTPILVMILPFIIIGVVVPMCAYRYMHQQTIVDRIRDAE